MFPQRRWPICERRRASTTFCRKVNILGPEAHFVNSVSSKFACLLPPLFNIDWVQIKKRYRDRQYTHPLLRAMFFTGKLIFGSAGSRPFLWRPYTCRRRAECAITSQYRTADTSAACSSVRTDRGARGSRGGFMLGSVAMVAVATGPAEVLRAPYGRTHHAAPSDRRWFLLQGREWSIGLTCSESLKQERSTGYPAGGKESAGGKGR